MGVEIEMLVSNNKGRVLAEIEPELQSVAWKINAPAEAKFFVAYQDDKCTPTILNPSNRVLIRFSNGLPNWGGVIEWPLGPRTAGVDVTAWTGEKLLDLRRSDKDTIIDGLLPGDIFRNTINGANLKWDTGIVLNNIYRGGNPRQDRWHYYNLLRRLQELARLSGQDFAITAFEERGVITFKADWFRRRGRDLRGKVAFEEDRNVSGDPRIDKQGPLRNVIYTIGDGIDWGEDRNVGEKRDDESIARHGFREYDETRSGIDDQATLDAEAQVILDDLKNPQTMVGVDTLDEQPGRFRDYDIGDIVDTLLHIRGGDIWAYQEPVRIEARSWTSANVCAVEGKEWHD